MIELWTNLPDVDSSKVRRLKRDEYDRMVELGMFEREHVELIRGVIVRMSPQGAPHAGAIEALTELLVTRLVGRARVRVQLPLLAPDDSEPEPDLAVVDRGNPHQAHPAAAHLVIEVARTSGRYDRDTKGPLYAEMGVAEYWVVDVAARSITVYRDPRDGRYAHVETPETTESITLVAFPDVSIRVATVLGL